MNDSRTNNSIRNVFWSCSLNLSVVVFPFILRSLFLKYIGEEILGITTLFTSIIQVLSITELGISRAISASLYIPVAEGNKEEICALLKQYKKIYRIVGVVILSLGLIITPFLHLFMKNADGITINYYVLWLALLVSSCIGYFLYSYDISLLYANQREDISRKVDLTLRVFEFALQFLVIVKYRSAILYVIIKGIHQIFYNVLCRLKCKKMYPDLEPNGVLNKKVKEELYEKVKALTILKLGSTLSNSVDAIFISSFIGLTAVTIYGNYMNVITAVTSFLAVACSALIASIGNSIVCTPKGKNYEDFVRLSYINAWVVGWCCVCFTCIFQSFMKCWVGDKLLFSMSIEILLVMRFYFERIRSIVSAYKDALGLWQPDKWRPIIGGVVNIILSYFLVINIGASGVVIATIISYVAIEIPWENHTLFNHYFDEKEWDYYKVIIRVLVTMAIAGAVTYVVCDRIRMSDICEVVIKLLICTILPNLVFCILNIKNEYFAMSRRLLFKLAKSFVKIGK